MTAIITAIALPFQQKTDVSDAVLLARFVAEDSDVNVTKQGKKNADCNRKGQPDSDCVKVFPGQKLHIFLISACVSGMLGVILVLWYFMELGKGMSG